MELKLWKGYQLIAFDGTSVSLPTSPELKEKFGIYASTHKGTKTCLARVLLCYDVLGNYILGCTINNMNVGEQSLFRKMLPQICQQTKTIVLLDRGFDNLQTVNYLLRNNFKMCIRMATARSHFAKKVMQMEGNDFIIDWKPTKDEKRKAKKLNLPFETIKVRVTKVLLKTGEVELLVSNLFDLKEITSEEMGTLYFKRWGIEEGIKKLKPKMKLEFFGCKKTEGVYQEFYSHIFMLNLVELISTEAQQIIDSKTKNRKYKYKYNWQNAYRYLRNRIIELIHSTKSIAPILKELTCVIQLSPIPIKENRQFPREIAQRNNARSYPCYK